MALLYFCPECSLKALKEALAAFESVGYDTDNVSFGVAWDKFLGEVPDGGTVVVYSVDFFPSLMELLSTLAQLQEREITLKSLKEPWLSEEVTSTPDFLVKLKELAVALHRNRTKQGIKAAQARGVKVGRPNVARK